MKSLAILFTLFVVNIYTVKGFAQYSLSPRVGQVIDQNEREYFGLFPTIEGFVSAKASVRQDRSVEFIITRGMNGNNIDTTFTVSPSVVENLVMYIEDFEKYRRKEKTVKWHILEKLAANAPSIEYEIGDVPATTIRTRSGEQLHGYLLYANDSILVIWQSTEQYNWRTLLISAKVVKYSDIQNIIIEQQGSFWLGLGYGSLLGATTVATTGLGLNVGNDINRQGHTGARASDYILIGTAFGAGIGAIIGGIIGATQDSDKDVEISGQAEQYLDILHTIKKYSVFLPYPPPELVRFSNQ